LIDSFQRGMLISLLDDVTHGVLLRAKYTVKGCGHGILQNSILGTCWYRPILPI